MADPVRQPGQRASGALQESLPSTIVPDQKISTQHGGSSTAFRPRMWNKTPLSSQKIHPQASSTSNWRSSSLARPDHPGESISNQTSNAWSRPKEHKSSLHNNRHAAGSEEKMSGRKWPTSNANAHTPLSSHSSPWRNSPNPRHLEASRAGKGSAKSLRVPDSTPTPGATPIPQSQRSWGRLKPPPSDPMEEYGLPSKGETRLNDKKAQEVFYDLIVERYMKFCAAHSEASDSLAGQFESLTLAGSVQKRPLIPSSTTSSPWPSKGALAGITGSKVTTSSAQLYVSAPSSTKPSEELEAILMAMRKLRESLTATRRTDEMAQRVHVFIVRAALLCSVAEAYHPSLKALLEVIHPVTPLPSSEFNEFTTYLILDKACRQGDLVTARQLRINTVGYSNHRVDSILQALVRKDWVSFWRLWTLVDGYERGVMAWAVEGLRLHSLKCMAKSYFSVDRAYLERVTGEDWERLQEFGLGWELERLEESNGGVVEKIVIRRPKARTVAPR